MTPIDVTGDNVLALPISKREPVDATRMLQPVPYGKCEHLFTAFEVDPKGGKCRCKGCGDEVSPMFVLERLMHQESQWMRTRAAYQDEMKRLHERSRTTCQHCNRLTRISR